MHLTDFEAFSFFTCFFQLTNTTFDNETLNLVYQPIGPKTQTYDSFIRKYILTINFINNKTKRYLHILYYSRQCVAQHQYISEHN